MTTVVRNVTVPQPVTSLAVQTYGGMVRVAAGPVSRVHVTETIMYDTQVGPLSAAPGLANAGQATGSPPASLASIQCRAGPARPPWKAAPIIE